MGNLLPIILVSFLVIAVLAVFVRLKSRQPAGQAEELEFEARRELFSPAERSFLGVLEQAVAGELRVLGKVRLGDLIQPARGLAQNRRTGLRNRIQQKHVDFVLCRPDTFAVAGVVELDDASHGRRDRAERDGFVDEALASAGVPVVHFPARKGYAMAEVRAMLAGKVGMKVAAAEPARVAAQGIQQEAASAEAIPAAPEEPVSGASVAAAADSVPPAEKPSGPECPVCSSVMIKRQAKKGQHAGKWFWACSGYPECRKILAVG